MNAALPISLEQDQRGQWAWFCDECGWAGFGLPTQHSAHREGMDHVQREHARREPDEPQTSCVEEANDAPPVP